MNIAVSTVQRVPHSTIIRGYKDQKEAVDQMVQLAWIAAYTILWNGTADIKNNKPDVYAFIRQFIVNATDLQSGFDAFIQRLLLARQYMRTDKGLLKVDPKEWFNSSFTGFCKTEKLYQRLQATRKERPLWRQGFKAFTDAVFDYGGEPSVQCFHYWRSYFQRRNSQSLLNLFLSFANNVQIILCCEASNVL